MRIIEDVNITLNNITICYFDMQGTAM